MIYTSLCTLFDIVNQERNVRGANEYACARALLIMRRASPLMISQTGNQRMADHCFDKESIGNQKRQSFQRSVPRQTPEIKRDRLNRQLAPLTKRAATDV